MNEIDLLALKRKIKEAKEEKAKLEGRKEALLDNLEVFEVKSVATGKNKLDKLKKAIQEAAEQIEEMTSQLEEQMHGSDTDTEE